MMTHSGAATPDMRVNSDANDDISINLLAARVWAFPHIRLGIAKYAKCSALQPLAMASHATAELVTRVRFAECERSFPLEDERPERQIRIVQATVDLYDVRDKDLASAIAQYPRLESVTVFPLRGQRPPIEFRWRRTSAFAIDPQSVVATMRLDFGNSSQSPYFDRAAFSKAYLPASWTIEWRIEATMTRSDAQRLITFLSLQYGAELVRLDIILSGGSAYAELARELGEWLSAKTKAERTVSIEMCFAGADINACLELLAGRVANLALHLGEDKTLATSVFSALVDNPENVSRYRSITISFHLPVNPPYLPLPLAQALARPLDAGQGLQSLTLDVEHGGYAYEGESTLDDLGMIFCTQWIPFLARVMLCAGGRYCAYRLVYASNALSGGLLTKMAHILLQNEIDSVLRAKFGDEPGWRRLRAEEHVQG